MSQATEDALHGICERLDGLGRVADDSAQSLRFLSSSSPSMGGPPVGVLVRMEKTLSRIAHALEGIEEMMGMSYPEEEKGDDGTP